MLISFQPENHHSRNILSSFCFSTGWELSYIQNYAVKDQHPALVIITHMDLIAMATMLKTIVTTPVFIVTG